MSSDKPEKKDPDASTPDLDALDSSWDEDELDEDATRVAKIPRNLVELSRMKDLEATAPPREQAPPEKHEAITARPPPPEPLVVVDAPHEVATRPDLGDEDGSTDEDEDEDEDEIEEADAEQEARARAADVAAGLDAEARRGAIEARAAERRVKTRSKAIAAKERRRARQEELRQKQKKPKKRSIPPKSGQGDERGAVRASGSAPPKAEAQPQPVALASPRRDWIRMALLVAAVILLGAIVIGLAQR